MLKNRDSRGSDLSFPLALRIWEGESLDVAGKLNFFVDLKTKCRVKLNTD